MCPPIRRWYSQELANEMPVSSQLDISKAICNVFTSKNQNNHVLKIESTKYEAMIAAHITVTAPVIYLPSCEIKEKNLANKMFIKT